MAFCAQCGKSHEPCGGPVPIGDTAKPCAKLKGAIWIHVMDDAGNDVATVPSIKDGETKNGDGTGVATFEGLDPGSYKVDLGALSDQIKADYDPPKGKTARKEKVTGGVITYVDYTLIRKAALKVKVVSKDSATLFEGASVDVTGPQNVTGKKTAATGIADCRKVTAGKYTIKVKLKDKDEEDWATTIDFAKKTEEITLSPGDDKEVVIEVEKKNEVTPKLELEYCVVLLDNKLHAKQSGGTKIMASPTYVEVSLIQTNDDHKFAKGAKLECSPANVEIYLDDEMTKKVSGGKITKENLAGDDPLKLYLKGVTAGKFTAKVTLDDPADRFVKLKDNPTPEQKMGVLKLELKFHQQDIAQLKGVQVDPDTNPEATYHTNLEAKVLPDQKLMTDAEKVGVSSSKDGAKAGRLLHLQASGNFGRAKLILAKIDGAQVPDEADAYEIVLNSGLGHAKSSGDGALKSKDLMGGPSDKPSAGDVSFWDKEFLGAAQNPAKLTIAQLKAAEKIFFVEGTAESGRTCDVRVDAGMDRADGGLAKTAKRNGDWGRFSVVKIKEIKVKYKPASGKPVAWDSTTNRFSINLKKDPAGRNIDIEVELNKPLKNIALYFMLAPDKDNKKTANWGIDMPAAWTWSAVTKDVKHKDKADRKDLLHLSEKTDSDGKAKKTLTLSRFGGDKFWPACYIEQDAHLAKYVDGHAQLGVKVPDRATSPVEVWRKFWYQLINVAGVPNPGVAGAVGQYDRVKSEMTAATPKTMTVAQARDLKAIYPLYMVKVNGGNADCLVVSDKNKKKFFSGISAEGDKPIKIPILICDAQWDPGPDTDAVDSNFKAANASLNLKLSRLVLTPPLQGGKLIVSGQVEYRYDDPANPGTWITPAPIKLTDANVDINPARDDRKRVRVTAPAAVATAFATHPTTQYRVLGLSVKGAKGPYLGESFDKKVLAVYDPAEPVDFQNTIAHEVGHGFAQTIEPGQQASGIPNHPNQYVSFDSDGMRTGSHCNKDTDKCVMYQSGPIVGSHNRYCDSCQPYMLVQDLSKYE